MKKIISSILILALCVTLFSGCKKVKEIPPTRNASLTKILFNTSVTIEINDIDCADVIANEAMEICTRYDSVFNRYKTGQLDHLNINGKETIEVGTDLYNVIKTAVSFSKKTNGAFDITIAPLLDLWDFSSKNIPPEQSEIYETLNYIGYDKIIFEEENQIGLIEGTQIDLGTVAKGYAADRVYDFLKKKGVKRAIINIGGDVKVIGDDYNIGIQKPFGKQDTFIAYVNASDISIMTSGSYQKYFEYGDQIYHHILDPKTGYPVNNGVLSVTVINASAQYADMLSTTAFVLGLEKGIKLVEKFKGAEAIFILEDMSIVTTDGIELSGDNTYKIK